MVQQARLRAITLTLSGLVLATTLAGGLLYYVVSRERALGIAREEGQSVTRLTADHIDAHLGADRGPLRILAGDPNLHAALSHPTPDSFEQANRALDRYQEALSSDGCYLLDARGMAIASSNRSTPQSAVGHDFRFRPYFQQALRGETAIYLAIGATTGERGVYVACPVVPAASDRPVGVASIKFSAARLERQALATARDGVLLVVAPHGVVFLSSRPEWLNRTLTALSPAEVSEVAASRQFGAGPWPWSGLRKAPDGRTAEVSGKHYLLHKAPISGLPGWTVVYLQDLESVTLRHVSPLNHTFWGVFAGICGLAGALVLLLYRGAAAEIAQRRATEDEAHRARAYLDTVLNTIPSPVLVIDRNHRVTLANRAARERGACGDPATGGVLCHELSHGAAAPCQGAHNPCPLQLVLAEKRPVSVTHVHRSSDGESRTVDIRAAPIFDAAGEVNQVLEVCYDVTDITRAADALGASEQRHRELVENLPVGLYRRIPGPRSRFLTANRALLRMLGCAAIDEVPDDLEDASFVDDPEGRRLLSERLRRDGQVTGLELRLRRPDGSVLWAAVTAKVVRDASGQITHVDGLLEDITERKRAQEELARKIEELEAFNRITVGRELRMIELKAEINGLLGAAGQPPRYELAD
ncbi:MAG: PAS domain S-box protein [Deltaproteobacteria bacterium]|nr:PAS domain S-box protein [Deltaproteobacteria bacterium]